MLKKICIVGMIVMLVGGFINMGKALVESKQPTETEIRAAIVEVYETEGTN